MDAEPKAAGVAAVPAVPVVPFAAIAVVAAAAAAALVPVTAAAISIICCNSCVWDRSTFVAPFAPVASFVPLTPFVPVTDTTLDGSDGVPGSAWDPCARAADGCCSVSGSNSRITSSPNFNTSLPLMMEMVTKDAKNEVFEVNEVIYFANSDFEME